MIWSIKQGKYLKEELSELKEYLDDNKFYTALCFENKISPNPLCYVFSDEIEAGKLASLIFKFYYEVVKNLT